jgi:3-oxoacyl-[acyl-carrier protein] reductase
MTKALVDEGYSVIACDRRTDRDPAEWRESFGDGAAHITTHVMNVADEADVQRVADELGAAGRQVAYLVNNAGIQGPGRIERFDSRRFDLVVRVNLYGTFFVTKAFTGPMIERNFGRIVNLASVNAYDKARNQAAYAAAKAGIIGLTRSVALDLAANNITVNAIAPGLMWHEGLAEVVGESGRDRLVRDIPSHQAGEPRHIANAVAYLFSDDAAYHTGQVMHINGGLYFGS